MKISTQIRKASSKLGEEKAVELVAKAGFDAWDFSMGRMLAFDWTTQTYTNYGHPLGGDNYLAFARKLKQIGLDNGIVCNQSHAVYPYTHDVMPYLKRCIECTAEAGGEICVIHPDTDRAPRENAEIFFELLPCAKECGVKIAVENIWKWDDEKNTAAPAACSLPENFNAHLDAVNDEYFVACLDIGHAEMEGLDTSAVEMIHALGNRIKALHIHDNNKHKDLHQIPFSKSIDFKPIVKALKDINYNGYFTLEADEYLSPYPDEKIFDGLKDLQKSARRLADMFESM